MPFGRLCVGTEGGERNGGRAMKRQRGLVNLTRALLTSFLLLIVLAVGFAVGRMMVARTYAAAMPKLERLPVAEPEVAARPADDRPFLPSPVSVPPPAPPEEPVGEGLDGALGAEGTGDLPAVPERTEGAPREAPAEVPRPQAEREPPGGLIAPVRPPQAAEGEGARYSIQVGVFSMLGGARAVADELSQAGYPSEIEVTSAEGQSLYRVLTGRYRSEYPARKALDELKKEGYTGFLVRR